MVNEGNNQARTDECQFQATTKANKNHQTTGQSLDWNFFDSKFGPLIKAFIY